MWRSLFLSIAPFVFCSAALAQFKERPGEIVPRVERATTHVEGNLHKVLDFPIGGRVLALAFSPKGNCLAVATATTLTLVNETGARQLIIWDALKESGKTFSDRPDVKATLAFSPDGKYLFYCGPQGLMVWRWAQEPSVNQKPVRVWTAPDVYNMTVVDDTRLVCAAKRELTQYVQLRKVEKGEIAWEKRSGQLPVTALQNTGTAVRAIVGNESNSQINWSEWSIADGRQSYPVDMIAQSAFSASLSPDGKMAATVNKELSLNKLDTSDVRVATEPDHLYPYHPFYLRRNYDPYYLYYPYYDHYYGRIDTGWQTLFSPDGNIIASLGREAVFYEKDGGTIVARIYFSSNPYPLPGDVDAETDGVGCFSSDGHKFALVRQPHVAYSALYNEATSTYSVRRQVTGASAVEIYALGAG